MAGRVILTEYRFNPETTEETSTWLVRHTSRKLPGRITTLEQDVSLVVDSNGRMTPNVCLDDFPQGLSEREAMLKLSNWLHRLSVSIEDHWSDL